MSVIERGNTVYIFLFGSTKVNQLTQTQLNT